MEDLPYVYITTSLVILVTFLGCYLYLNRRKKLPPGPWMLPVIGNIVWFMRQASSPDSPGVMFWKASKGFGELMYLRIFKQGLLVINGYDAIHDCFVKHADQFSDRPYWMSPFLKETLKEGRGLIWQTGEDWKKMRKFVQQSLREFGLGKTSLADKILTEIEAASKVLTETAGEPYDMQSITRLMIGNIIHDIVFGKRFDYDDDKVHYIRRRISVLFKKGGVIDFTTRLPNFILKLFGRDKEKESAERLEAVMDIKNYIYKEISEHEETFDANNIRDFIDLYIQNKQAGEDTHLFTAGNVFRTILDLFVAGSDTTSNILVWFTLYMVEYPDVQKRCQDEIQEMCGHQNIRWSHKNKLPYVEATLTEILRLVNVVELSLPHTNEGEITVRGYTIPKRTLILANLVSSNLDPRYWDEPDKFKPERFLEDGQIKKNVAFMPFSTGPRMCTGEPLARMQLFLVFANFLQRFTFRRENSDVPNSFERDKTQIASPPVAFKTRIIQRS